MRLVQCIVVTFLFAACRDTYRTSGVAQSKWLRLKDSFPHQNLRVFKLDDSLLKRYKNFQKVPSKWLDSTLSEQWSGTYLYSWQQRDPALIEFTTIVWEEDLGTRIMYYVFNKKDSLLSEMRVALRSGEAGLDYSLSSRFKGKDTLLLTSAVTQVYDTHRRQRPAETKGDTAILQSVIRPNGTIATQQSAKKGN